MHICLDFIPELIAQPRLDKQVSLLVIPAVITGPPTRSVVGQTLVTVAGVCCRRLSSVIICNAPWRTCRQLQPCRPRDDVMPPAV